MVDEYKPTRKVEQPGEGESARHYGGSEHQHTVPISDSRRDRAGGYGSGAPESRANKTVRLEREPPTFAWLVLTEGVHAGHIFRLHPDVTLVGRDPSADIVIDDPAVSRQHAKIRVVEGEEKEKIFVLHDLATENGTFVNDEDILKHDLNDGDRVRIGETKLVFKQLEV
jgi:hypothetical protein